MYIAGIGIYDYESYGRKKKRVGGGGGAHIVHSLKTERQNCYEDTKVIYFSVL